MSESGQWQSSVRSNTSSVSTLHTTRRLCRQVLAVGLGVSLGVGIGITFSARASPAMQQEASRGSVEHLKVKLASALERAEGEEKKVAAAEVRAETRARGAIDMMKQAKRKEKAMQATATAAEEKMQETEKKLQLAEARLQALQAKSGKSAQTLAGRSRFGKDFTASLECALLGGLDCSGSLEAWAEGACVANVWTNGGTCKKHCEDRGMRCIKAMASLSKADLTKDSSDRCSLDEASHSKQTREEGGCLQRHENQICACEDVGHIGADLLFYMYDDPIMQMSALKATCASWGRRDADVELIEQAASHPLRTRNPKQAKFFLVTIPIVTSFSCGPKKNHTNRTMEALQHLVGSRTWKATRGERHVWMLFDWRIMRWADSEWKLIPDDPKRGEWSDHRQLLSNMTVLTYENWQTHPRTCTMYSAQFNNYCHPKDFNWLPFEMWACTVVVPYFAAEGLSRKDVSMLFPNCTFAEWQKRETILFYRNDQRKDYHWGATAVRRKPQNLSGLPNVSIGGNIPKVKHIRGMSESKFCLVTRGDTPSSHKIFDAIRSLCIPVIVSDLWHRVAKPFPTLLAWDAFSLSIPEPHFMKDPQQAIAFLWTLSIGELRRLFHALYRARLAVDWRAPDSRTTTFVLASIADTCPLPGVQ